MILNTVRYYRSRLDEHDQKVYDELFQHWMHLEDNFVIPMPHCDLGVLTRAVHWDNPILFYIDYYRITYARTLTSVHVKGGYLYSKEDARKYLGVIEKWGNEVIRKLPAVGMAEQALWLHDVVLANVKYGKSRGVRAHNLVGVICDGEAVCEGISKTYKFLCDLAGIPCAYVSGTLNQGPHGWNMLWIAGGTSFVDVTNDLRLNGTYDRSCFLRSADQMYGYTWDDTLIPDCKVHNKSNPYLTVHNRRELIREIRSHLSNDSMNIRLQFGRRLSRLQIDLLVQFCGMVCPALLTRKISYSVDQQLLLINR